MCFSSSDGEYVAYFIRMVWLFKTISFLEIRSTLCSLQKSRKETFCIPFHVLIIDSIFHNMASNILFYSPLKYIADFLIFSTIFWYCDFIVIYLENLSITKLSFFFYLFIVKYFETKNLILATLRVSPVGHEGLFWYAEWFFASQKLFLYI